MEKSPPETAAAAAEVAAQFRSLVDGEDVGSISQAQHLMWAFDESTEEVGGVLWQMDESGEDNEENRVRLQALGKVCLPPATKALNTSRCNRRI